MRHLSLLLAACLFSGCYAAPGTPRTDLGTQTTEHTGHYDVVGREVENGRYVLRVEAVHPERAELIAANLVHMLRPLSPREVVVEIAPAEGRGGEARTITWTRPATSPRLRTPETAPAVPDVHGTSPADRQGARPTQADEP